VYCSKECQTRHWWNGHNRQCKLFQAQETLEKNLNNNSNDSSSSSNNNNNENDHTSAEKNVVLLPNKIVPPQKPTNLPLTRPPSRILFPKKRVIQMLEFEDKSLQIGMKRKSKPYFALFSLCLC
jgi:hypothetical protein